MRRLWLVAACVVLASVAIGATGGGCMVRGPTIAEGAGIGAAIGGPYGTMIGTGIALIGLVIRHIEKGRMVRRHADEKVALTRQIRAESDRGTAPTAAYRASEALDRKPTAPAVHLETI